MANQHKSLDKRLEDIRTFANDLKTASRWKESEKTISNLELITNEDTKREYIYEFWCYIRILRDLKENYDVVLHEGKEYGVLFPKAPGKKENYPYFSIKDKLTGEEKFQLCTGIKIKNIADEEDAPDISFINAGLKEPIFEDVFMIYDAKFKHDATKKVSKSAFNDVSAFVRNLGCEEAEYAKVEFEKFVNEDNFNGNLLLTNGKAYKENPVLHYYHNMKEVEGFDLDKEFNIIG